MYDCTIGIKRTGNGYTVMVRDPEIVKANREEKTSYKDPDLQYVFETAKEAATFVAKAIEKIEKMDDEYETAFAKALREHANG